MELSPSLLLSAPERSEGAEVFKKHVRDADDHVGAKCEIRPRRGLSTAPSVCPSVRLSVCPSVCPLLTVLV